MTYAKQRPLSLAGQQRARSNFNLKRTIAQINPRVKDGIHFVLDAVALAAFALLFLAALIKL